MKCHWLWLMSPDLKVHCQRIYHCLPGVRILYGLNNFQSMPSVILSTLSHSPAALFGALHMVPAVWVASVASCNPSVVVPCLASSELFPNIHPSNHRNRSQDNHLPAFLLTSLRCKLKRQTHFQHLEAPTLSRPVSSLTPQPQRDQWCPPRRTHHQMPLIQHRLLRPLNVVQNLGYNFLSPRDRREAN